MSECELLVLAFPCWCDYNRNFVKAVVYIKLASFYVFVNDDRIVEQPCADERGTFVPVVVGICYFVHIIMYVRVFAYERPADFPVPLTDEWLFLFYRDEGQVDFERVFRWTGEWEGILVKVVFRFAKREQLCFVK